MQYRSIVVAAFVIAACIDGSSSVSFTPTEDDAAIAAIASTWSAGGASLSLCEVANSPEPDGCSSIHTVRGRGQGRAHTVALESGGCGGCPRDAAASVQGAATLPGAPGPVAVRGEVLIHTAYEFPYFVRLSCTDPAQPCLVTGQLHEDGSLVLDAPPSQPGATAITLARAGAASCP